MVTAAVGAGMPYLKLQYALLQVELLVFKLLLALIEFHLQGSASSMDDGHVQLVVKYPSTCCTEHMPA